MHGFLRHLQQLVTVAISVHYAKKINHFLTALSYFCQHYNPSC